MAEGLEEKLLELKGSFSKEDPINGSQKGHDIVGDIGHICLHDLTEKDIEYACSLLFNKEHGIISYLRKTTAIDEYQPVKAEILEFLLAFVKQYEKKVLPYAVDVKEISVSLFSRERFAKVKNGCIPLLIEVLQLAMGSKMEEDLQIEKMRDKFFMELIQGGSKLTATVKQQLYHLLGVLADVFFEKMISHSDRLLDIYIKALKAEMTSKTRKPEFPVIAGCFLGLTHLLVNFTQSAEEEAKHSYDIYKYTKMALDPAVPLSRYEMPRCALELLRRHASQFSPYLVDEYEVMYERLKHWSGHHNRDMMHAGHYALESFLKQISEQLVVTAEEGRRNTAQFKFFIHEFRGVMDNPSASSKEVSLAIRGYGYFAAPCKIFLTNEDVKFMFNEMIQRSEQLFLTATDTLEDRIISLPSFLQALASIVHQLDQVTDVFLSSLERLVVLLIEHFAKLSKKLHFPCFLAILKVFYALAPKGAVFKGFLSHIVYQGLIRTCSHPIVLETEEQTAEQSEVSADIVPEKFKISYKEFLPLWTILLESHTVKELRGLGISLTERQAMTAAVYDELIQATLAILARLDLSSNTATQLDQSMPSTSEEEEPEDNAASQRGLQAAKPKDFIIFINLVDFSRELLPNKQYTHFRRWIMQYGHALILQSSKLPLVSGFYKLLACCMTICGKLNYFKNVGDPLIEKAAEVKPWIKVEKEEDSQGEAEMEEEGALHNKQACFLLFSKFTKEVLVRMQQYKDELLAACLTFILALPAHIVTAQITAVVPALQLTLSMGRSYLPLAVMGLEALERWSSRLPASVIRPHYATLLPCLDAYLSTATDTGADEVGERTMVIQNKKPSMKRAGKRKIPIRLLKNKHDSSKPSETALAAVRQRCVRLLGSLGGAVNSLLIAKTTEQQAHAVAWDTERHLKFDMPFMDIKPTIYFDPFLPRIVELATSSSDRQTKVAACELLHSLVLFMLGRSTIQPGAQRTHQGGLELLFKKIFPAILKLACDVEQVARQLFEPLMMQLIHWFTSAAQIGSPDTIVLINTILDGIVDPSDSTTRDFSATCIKEFLKWSIKQTSKKQMESSPHNVTSLLKRLYALARHPSAFKRLGAALAFNNLYAVFREEESLVERFIFELLVVYVDSLALAHNDDKALGTQEKCAEVLEHIEKIMRVKRNLLNTETPKQKKIRRHPKNWKECTLTTVIKWLLRQCGRPQTECRHQCMQLVYKLSAHVPGSSGAKDVFDSLIHEQGVNYIIVRFEEGAYKSLSGKYGLSLRHHMSKMDDTFSVKTCLNWFDMVLAGLDCYCWAFSQGLVTPAIFSAGGSGGKKTSVFKVLIHFVNDLALHDIYAAAKVFENKPASNELFTPREIDTYNKAKCTVIIRMLNFICVCFGKYRADSLKAFPGEFWSDSLWQLVVTLTLDPTSLGFNMGDVEIMDKLPEEIGAILTVISRCLTNYKHDFLAKLSAAIRSKRGCDLAGTPIALTEEEGVDFTQVSQVLIGYEQLQRAGVLSGAVNVEKLAHQLLDNVFKSLVMKQEDKKVVQTALSPTSEKLANQILHLVFTMKLTANRLLSRLLDKSPVNNTVKQSASFQGSIFYATYRSTINAHLTTIAREFVPLLIIHASKESGTVGTVLIGLLDHVGRDRQLRKKEGGAVSELVLGSWAGLRCWWEQGATQETKTLALSLLTKLIILNSKVVSDGKHPAFADVFAMYLHTLTDTSTSLAFKTRAMDLLPFFAALPAAETKKLKGKLDRLVTDCFPHKSTEYTAGSPKHNDYIAALNKLLYALELSGSAMLLEVLMSVICREERHVHEDDIQAALTRFIKRIPAEKQKAALDIPYEIYKMEGRYNNLQRRAALERVCLTLLRGVKTSALSDFFTAHIADIMATIEAKTIKGSEDAFETQLVSKLCCFQLAEILFSRLPKDNVCSKSSKINTVFCKGKVDNGKELAKALTVAGHGTKNEDMRGETVLLELRRQLHCCAYNTLIAVISCVQTDAKFYNGFLFSEDIAKGQFLWENLVDSERTYEFPVVMEAPMLRRKRFVAIRNEAREERQGEEQEEGLTPYSVHYLASQYLADSSLSAEVSQYDFSSTAHASAFSSAGSVGEGGSLKEGRLGRRKSLAPRPSVEDEPAVTVSDDYVEMEEDALNDHECMAPLTALLQHMQRNHITPPLDKGSTPTELPKWMANMRDKLQSSRTPNNVKLFLAKLIVNTEEVFRPYAKFWLAPLVHYVVCGGAGSEINYFVTDVVVTILSWHTHAIPEDTSVERAMASKLTEFLMRHCHHDDRRVLRNNLELLKTLVEVWRSRIDVPTGVLFEKFTDKDQKSKRNATGIQMVGVVLANRLPPWRSGEGVDQDRFFKFVAMNMTHPSKLVYAAAAEVVGMCLHFLEQTDKGDAAVAWRDTYTDNISKMLLSAQQAKPDQFITCVHKMHLHHPPVADKFMAKILFMLPKMHGEFRTNCLEIVQSRVDHVNNCFLEMKNKGLLDLLTHRDEGAQLAALRLVQGMLKQLKAEELLQLMPAVTSCAQLPAASCRALMYNILMWIYDNYRNKDSEACDRIMTLTKDTLLRGLNDDHLPTRLTVQNFWSDETRLPVGTLDRLVAMLQAMYSPATESAYLSYATNLLLEMTSKSPDYHKQIFEKPLSECKFQDYTVRSSWKQRHSSMTPLFASQSQSDMSSPSDDVMDTTDGGVRQTQATQQFTQTQAAAGSGAPFNWLTQSSLDTYAADYTLTQNTETQSSLLFTMGKPRPADNKAPRPGAGGRGAGPLRAAAAKQSEVSASQGQEILRLKRRFVRDQQSTQLYFIKRELRLKQQRQQVERERKQRRENQVTMYRTYRIGDLPDIQIHHSSLIAPLQALAQRDSGISRLLFGSVFKAIFAEIESIKTERESRETCTQINKGLNDMLSNSSQYYPPFIGCIMDIAQANPRQLSLNADAVNTACSTSLQQPLGITLLEEVLVKGGTDTQAEDKPAPKRRRGNDGASTSAGVDTDSWLELARLYKSVGDYDVLRGIFSSRLGTQELTSQALDLEMRADYLQASKLYTQGLEKDWGAEAPSDVELDLWEDSRLECWNQLASWDQLQSTAMEQAEGGQLDAIWDDTWYMERMLGYLMRARTKNVLAGDEEQDDFLNFVDGALKVPERKQVLENKYMEELALLYVWQEDYDRARHYAACAVTHFLQDWSGIDSLMTASRALKLQCLQKLTELQEFIEFMSSELNFDSFEPANRLAEKWAGRCPDVITDSAHIWDDIVTNRCVYVDHMSNRLEKLSKLDAHKGSQVFERRKVLFQLEHAQSAMEQDNFYVALSKEMKRTRKVIRRLADPGLNLHWTHTYARIQQKRCLVTDLALEDKISALSGVITNLEKEGSTNKGLLSAEPGLSSAHSTLHGQSLHVLTQLLHTHAHSFSDLASDLQETVAKIAGCSKKSFDEIINGLVEKGYQYVKKSVATGAMVADAGYQDESVKSIEKAHLNLVKYCDTYLRQKEADEESPLDCPSLGAFPTAVVTSLLRGMKLNSGEVRQRFPRLLGIVELYPDTMATFVKLSSSVPLWMYLGWLPQMTALLDKPESPAVQQLLYDIALLYPNALVYPFWLSSDGYRFDTASEVGNGAKQQCERIRQVLERNKLITLFVQALEQFGQPNAIFRDFIDDPKLRKLLGEARKDMKAVKEIYKDMYNQLVNVDATESQEDLYSTTMPSVLGMGEYREKFAKKFAPIVEQAFGKDGSKLASMTYSQFNKKAAEIRNSMDDVVKSKARDGLMPPESLQAYSRFLADFQAQDFPDKELEVPGQYTGKSKPMPEYHVKVCSFGYKVMVMSSLRRPKRITILGNDQKEYKYLVKGGEDLRLDQRVEQLFAIMNQVFAQDAACRQRKLSLRTYEVIPMTPRVGLIEWVENTAVLKETIYGQLTESEQKNPNKPMMDHMSRLGENRASDYHTHYQKYSRTETTQSFRRCCNMVPYDLLRRAYLNMSASSEAFFTLKCNFATSHAQICICQWVLGIGDRHLSNFMIDRLTGKMVGIDFGHAFGSASQFLPIPELVPFRLTRQLLNVLMPLREKGLLEGTMIHTLRALRHNSDLLLSTMDVFVKEPSMDWEQNAYKQIRATTKGAEASALSEDLVWYPKQKIAWARKKLEGHNPVFITRDELKLNGALRGSIVKDYERVLLGDKSIDIRARLPKQGLSAEQQVASLLNQATDPNILGRMWVGWEPWV